jgi:1,4-alpha-glucan branching enzyme
MRKKNVKKPVTKKSVSRKTTNKHPAKTMNSGIKKQYLKTSPVCKVTFKLPKQAAPDAKNVTIVGDFNAWDTNKTHMKHLKNGDFKVTLTLSNNSELQVSH